MVAPVELVGSLVRLRTTTAADHDRLVAIRETDEVRRWWRGDDVRRELADDLDDDETTQLTVTLLTTGEIVGLIQFGEESDPEYRHASIDIYLDPAHHRTGLASDAIATVCDHLFDDRGHHRLVIDPSVDNTAAIACYRKLGFQPVGIMRQYELRGDGIWGDGLLMDMVIDDRSVLKRRR